MMVTSITNIQTSLANIEENLPSLRQYITENFANSLDTAQWGSESEYTPNDILKGLQNLTIDLASLVKDPSYFISLSTRDERNNIHYNLSQLASCVASKNLGSITSLLDNLKLILRPYYLTTDKKRMVVFRQKIDDLSDSMERITQLLEGAKTKEASISEISNAIQEKVESITVDGETISELLAKSEGAKNEIATLKEEVEQIATTIKTCYIESSEAKAATIAHRDEIQEFADEIQEHQKKLQKQADQFESFNETLKENTAQQKQYLDVAQRLIEDAKQALSYTTSVGLSASFDAQCKDLVGKNGFKLWSWLIAAVIAVGGVIGIGIWLAIEASHPPKADGSLIWIQIVSKLSMVPLLVTAAIFCANQYSKQKNLLEDYSYKLALSKSLVAFSEELRDKDQDKYKEYLSMVLREILQDPLRHRVDPNSARNTSLGKASLDNVVKLAENVVKLSKEISQVS
jgi:hypothetical protein